MANQYNFVVEDLLLSRHKVAQLTKALSSALTAGSTCITADDTQITADDDGITDPLQELCDEAAADVARLIAGYILDNVSVFNFIRSLAIFSAYSTSGTPVPPDMELKYKNANSELQSISRGERPNLPKQANAALQSRGGSWGSGQALPGRMPRQFPDQVAPTPFAPPVDPDLGTL